MRISAKVRAVLAVACMAVGGLATSVAAQGAEDYPQRPVTLVVPYPAGAAVDNVGRLVADGLRKALGQPVIVENKAGAGSQIGTAHVARSAPDGYTVLLTTLDALTLFPQVRDLGYSPDRDLIEIARIARIPYSVQAHPKMGAKNLADMLEQARKQPGTLRYGSTGNGSLAHVAMEALAQQAGVELIHVPYKGMAASVNDLLAGHIDLGVVSTSTIAPHVAAGKVVPLALMTEEDNPMWPDIPGLAHSGIKGVNAELEFVLVAPAGLPETVYSRLTSAMETMMADPELTASIRKLEMSPAPMFGQDIQERRRQDAARWAKVLSGMNVEKES